MIDKETGIWSQKVAMRKHRTDYILAAAIGTFYYLPPKTSADLGCGLGHYCRILTAYQWPHVVGYEGTPGIEEIAEYDIIVERDLSAPFPNGRDKFEFVLCLEVGEHIPRDREQTFLDNIEKVTGKDLVLSWAVPGQGGTGHFNERDNKYIIEELEKRELKYNPDMSKTLREYASRSWFKNTIMVFKK